MAVTSGFFNSINHDRVYDAKDFGMVFDGLITDGIYKKYGDAFVVTAGSGMTINVGSGRAWFYHTWILNTLSLSLNVEASDSTYTRIDAVCIEVNISSEVRSNSIKVIKGTPASYPSMPTLTNNDNIKQYPLATITIGPNVTSISQNDINDFRGNASCPFVRAIVDPDDVIGSSYNMDRRKLGGVLTTAGVNPNSDPYSASMVKIVANVNVNGYVDNSEYGTAYEITPTSYSSWDWAIGRMKNVGKGIYLVRISGYAGPDGTRTMESALNQLYDETSTKLYFSITDKNPEGQYGSYRDLLHGDGSPELQNYRYFNNETVVKSRAGDVYVEYVLAIDPDRIKTISLSVAQNFTPSGTIQIRYDLKVQFRLLYALSDLSDLMAPTGLEWWKKDID